MKVSANENLEEMSFISINFSTLFCKRIRKLGPTLKGTWESAKRIVYHRVFYAPLISVFFKLSLSFFHLQAALVTNALIPTSIFVSYYCWMSSSDSEKGEIKISLIVVLYMRTQTARKRRRHGFSSIFIRNMKTWQ